MDDDIDPLTHVMPRAEDFPGEHFLLTMCRIKMWESNAIVYISKAKGKDMPTCPICLAAARGRVRAKPKRRRV